MLISKANSVLPGVISIFNTRCSLRCAECSPRSRRRPNSPGIIVYPCTRARSECVRGARENVKFEGRKKALAAAFVPLGPRNDWEHSARFVGSYATGPVGSRTSRGP